MLNNQIKKVKIFLIKTRKRFYFFNADVENIFNTIYKRNLWKSKESISGPGSELKNTIHLQKQIQSIIKEYKIQSIVDCGCGDFNWMKEINFGEMKYTGLDIVNEIAESNMKKYATAKIKFIKLNTVNEIPPRADLLICRDVLVHLNFETIDASLKNMIASKSDYFLLTTFPFAENCHTKHLLHPRGKCGFCAEVYCACHK